MNLSFEDELTFVPKLNSLSLKLAGVNRTSIQERSPKKKNTNLDSTYTFKPIVSDNSSKIVAKLKTGFWERQNLHVKRQKEKIERGPSTIHPNLKRSFHSKETVFEKEKKAPPELLNSVSDQVCQNSKPSKKLSPYSKSMDGFSSKKKELQMLRFQKKCDDVRPSSKVKCNSYMTPSGAATIETKIRKSLSPQKPKKSEKNVIVISPRKLRCLSPLLATTADNDLKSKCTDSVHQNLSITNNQGEDDGEVQHMFSDTSVIEQQHKTPGVNENLQNRSSTYQHSIVSKLKTDKQDVEHQKLIRVKKIASQALKSKKVFVCNGPYSALRAALRRRGWIEKYFKGDPSSCVIDKESKKEDLQSDDMSGNDSGFSSDDSTKNTSCSKKTQEGGETSHDEVFSSDSQYGIMSRIVRNSKPTLIWTLKRDDIDFRLLNKDQMVNHYISAWTFTTKTGLCTNLRNIVAFDTVNWLTFFPRCYRLCCDEEKQEFIEDYRITTIQGILKLVILRHIEWKNIEDEKNAIKEELQTECYEDCQQSSSSPVPSKKNKNNPKNIPKKLYSLLPGNALSLVFGKCYSYLDMKSNQDIEEGYVHLDQSIGELDWSTIINYYNQIMSRTAIISNAWKHVGECQSILKQMESYCPQLKVDGHSNLWILKPGAKSRGRGIEIMNQLNEISDLASGNISQKENRWVIQKYIERPFLVYRTKFDIRQWFLVTDWNPMVLWFYKDCYIRFCSQEFTLNKFDAQFHLSNNSLQKNFQNGERSEHLPESNMWSSDIFKEHLCKMGKETVWDETIYPGMKSAIIAALQCCQNSLEYRKSSFELYGADFMLCEDLNPWLIEINSSPALGASTPVTEILCRNVIEDTLKVVLDRKDNKQCDTGRFELAYRQPHISIPSYMGCSVSIEGTAIKHPVVPLNKPPIPPSSKPQIPPSSKILNNKIKSTEPTHEKLKEKQFISIVKNIKNEETPIKEKAEKPAPKLLYEKNDKKIASKLDGIIAKLSMGAKNNNKKNLKLDSTSNDNKTIKKDISGKSIFTVTEIVLEEQNKKVNNNKNIIINKNTIANNNRNIYNTDNDVYKSNKNTIIKVNITNKNINNNNNNNNSNTNSNNTGDTNKKNNNNNNDTDTDMKQVTGKLKSHSPEPVSCSCCCASDESLVEALCPQVASYDLREFTTSQKQIQNGRLKNIKLKDKQRTDTGGFKSYKQYGVLDAEDLTGIKQINNHPPFLLNQYKNNDVLKNFRIKPKSHDRT